MITIHDILDVERLTENLNAVIFDLDDTLYSEKDYVKSGFSAVAKTLPQIENVEKQLWEAFESGRRPFDLVLHRNHLYTEQRKEECLAAYRRHKPAISLYPGVPDMLSALRRKELRNL